MKLIRHLITTSILTLTSASSLIAAGTPQISLVNTIASGDKKGTEIISIQASQYRAAISNSKKGIIDIYSIASPEAPERVQRIKLDTVDDEKVNSVAFHPQYNYVIAVIQAASPATSGRLEIRDASTGEVLNTLKTGVGPDAVIIDPTGSYALIPNEAEEFILDRKDNSYSTADGSLTLVTLDKDPSKIKVTQIKLTDLTGTAGFVKAEHKRFLERAIDWNDDGEITEEPLDINGNGKIDKGKISVGTYRGQTVKTKEKYGELFLFPIIDNKPDLLEPEYVAFSQDGAKAWVVLQENNGVITIDTKTATVSNVFGLGTTTHLADINDNDAVKFDTTLTALREPDGIALTKDDKYLVTADEGDSDPKASKVKDGPAAGGRTISVFDATTGQLLGDTGNQIDSAINAADFYPESRSDNRGSEPEMITSFTMGNINYVAAGIERANGVVLVSLANPKQPKVISVAAIDKTAKAGNIAPEGIAYFYDSKTKRHYIYTANEKGGSISIFRIDTH
jgi:DNA-binding beta-propeller fold protein YncE